MPLPYNVGDHVLVTHPPLSIVNEECQITRIGIMGISDSIQLKQLSNGKFFVLFGSAALSAISSMA